MSSMLEYEKAPFKLRIEVKTAENLPIGDVFTSDPYVVLSIGNKKIFKTHTIYKTLNPAWHSTVYTGLLHTNAKLLVSIFDADVGSDDDLLCTTSIDLSKMTKGKKHEDKYSLVNAGNFKGNPKINLTIFIERNDQVIKIIKNQPKPEKGLLEEPSYKAVINQQLRYHSCPEVILNTFKNFDTVKTYLLNPDLIKDLVRDVNLLSNSAIISSHSFEKTPFMLNRSELRLVSSSLIFFADKSCSRYSPIEEHSIQINLSEDLCHFVLVKFKSRYSMWIWARWLLLMNDIWSGQKSKQNVPLWANNRYYATHMISIHSSDGREYVGGRSVISFDRPFEFAIGKFKISLHPLISMVLAEDAVFTKPYTLEVFIESCMLDGENFSFEDQLIEEMEPPIQSPETKLQTEKKVSIFSALKKGVMGSKPGKNPVGVKKEPVKHLFHSRHSPFVLIKCGNISVKLTDKIPGYSDRFYMDLDVMALVNQSDSFLKSRSSVDKNSILEVPKNKHNGNIESLEIQDEDENGFLPLKRSSQLGMDILLYKNQHTLLAQKHTEMRDIVVELQSGLVKNFETKTNSQEVSSQFIEFEMDSNLGYYVSFMSGTGLAIDIARKNLSTFGKSMILEGCMVNEHGRKEGVESVIHKTDSITPSSFPVWKNQAFLFTSTNALGRAEFIRVEIFVEGLTKRIRMGAIFIPLEYFQMKAETYVFPVTRWKDTNLSEVLKSDKGGLGTITVNIKRIADIHNSKHQADLHLRTVLHEHNIFNSRFYAEVFPAGVFETLEQEDEMLERFTVFCGFSCLELYPIHQSHSRFEAESHAVRQSSTDFRQSDVRHSEPNDHETQQTSIHSEVALTDAGLALYTVEEEEEELPEVVVEVYQNQRRSPYPPFDWSMSAISRADFTDRDFTVSFNFNTLAEAEPPEGFQWVDEWRVDKNHIPTDENGWIYGFTFGRMLDNYHRGLSTTDPFNTHTRRRRWVRTSRAKSQRSAGNQTGTFQTQNQSPRGHDLHRSETRDISDVAKSLEAEKRAELVLKDLVFTPSGDNDQKESEWRNQIGAGGMLWYCQEKSGEDGLVRVPWEQVLDCSVLTPSVLCLYLSVHRYFGQDSGGEAVFRPAEVEVFVSNCPARELQSLVMERKWFKDARGTVQQLIRMGSLSGRRDDKSLKYAVGGDSDDDDEAGDVPMTEKLSMGAELIADLDDFSLGLEAKICELDEELKKSNDFLVFKEKAVLQRRDCRLRLYIATLLGASLEGSVELSVKAISRLMNTDFKRCRQIQLDTEVATARNRIEFLLDTAEQHIREVTLCGWSERSGTLVNCLQLLVSGYFVEVVDQLGAFFEGNNIEVDVSGLTNKVELITSFLKLNDRLDIITTSALKPYHLHTNPEVKPSVFLPFEKLVTWYSSVLLFEMRQRAKDIVSLWSDPQKDVSGCNELYNFPLPWVPQRNGVDDGPFITLIPEDLVEILVTYLQYARVPENVLAPSFRASIGLLDSRVELSFVSTFLYLSELYETNLKSKDWYCVSTDDDALDEITTYLCSVANDASRVKKKDLFSFNRHCAANAHQEQLQLKSSSTSESRIELETLMVRTYDAYEDLMFTGLDQVSCILFTYLFQGREELLTEGFPKLWVQDVREKGEISEKTGDNKNLFSRIIEDLLALLSAKEGFLDPHPFSQLFLICADKIITYYLWFLAEAWETGEVFPPKSDEILQIDLDILAIQGYFMYSELIPETEKDQVKEWLSMRLKFLENCRVILTAELDSQEFETAFLELRHRYGEAELQNSGFGLALASMAAKCLGLRGLPGFMSLTQKKRSCVTVGLVAPSEGEGHKHGLLGNGLFGVLGKVKSTGKTVVNLVKSEVGNALAIPEKDFTKELEIILFRELTPGELKVLKEGKIKILLGLLKTEPLLSETNFPRAPPKSTNLFFTHSVEEVFGNNPLSITVLLQHSALSPVARRAVSPRRPKPGGSIVVKNIKTIIEKHSYVGRFIMNVANRGGHKQSGEGTEKHLNTIPATGGGVARIGSPVHCRWVLPEGVPTIAITDLQVSNLFYLRLFKLPRPYLLLQMGGFSIRTYAQDVQHTAKWLDSAAVVLPIFKPESDLKSEKFDEVGRQSAATSLCELAISLYYESVVSDTLIGTIYIKFAPFVIPTFKNQVHKMEFENINTGFSWVLQGAKKALAEGRDLPAISLSITDNNTTG